MAGSGTGPEREDASAAFELAVANHGSALFGLILTILGNRADAEDAYQVALERAWRGWPSLRRQDSSKAWLSTICARTALRNRKSRGLWRSRHPQLDAAWRLGRLMPWDSSLGEALSELSPRQRAVISLHYGHGYALDEIASLLGCRGGTVRSHLNRALAHLRRRIDVEH